MNAAAEAAKRRAGRPAEQAGISPHMNDCKLTLANITAPSGGESGLQSSPKYAAKAA